MSSWQYTQIPLHPPPPHPQWYSTPPSNPPNAYYPYQAVPPPPAYGTNSTVQLIEIEPSASQHEITSIRTRKRKRRWVDYPTILLLFAVWTFLTISCTVLLCFSAMSTRKDSDAGEDMSGDEIAGTLAISAAPILIATILNEVLVDRCWKRVSYSALGKKASRLSNTKLAKNLRAANFEWLNFLKRVFIRRNVSFQDIRAVTSYGLLRWGSAISIASVQLCVSWHSKEGDQDEKSGVLYTAKKRYLFAALPVFLHACSVFGTMAIWFLTPWSLLSSRYDDVGFLDRYRPYLHRVSGGSIVNFESVARQLDSHKTHIPLGKEYKPGIQFRAKLKGIWFGLGSMCLPPAAAWACTQFIAWDAGIPNGIYRFAFHLVFLAQNIFYLLALDFAVWNMSLEGLCRGKRENQKPNKSLRHLGYSSGIMLFLRSFKQRRPIRSALFLWLFWLQACLVRGLTGLYALCFTVLSYGTKTEQRSTYDPDFWLAWVFMTVFFVFPLFGVWLFTWFQAPICEQDGWRWAKIAQTALFEDGFYGVRNGEAVWAMDVAPFNSHMRKKLY